MGERVVETERECLKELIEAKGYRQKDIFNMDETGLFYGYVPFLACHTNPPNLLKFYSGYLRIVDFRTKKTQG